MGLPSNIGYELEDGTIKAVCIYNSFEPELAGNKLETYYKDLTKVKQLIDLGDISWLGSEIGKRHDFKGWYNHYDWCLFYGRDRGEDEDIEPVIYNNLKEFIPPHTYGYLFRNGQWVVYQEDCPQGESVEAAMERQSKKYTED